METTVQLLGFREEKPVLGQHLTMAREFESLSEEKSLCQVETGEVDLSGGYLKVAIPQQTLCGSQPPLRSGG